VGTLSDARIVGIIIERRDLGGIMSNDCKDTLQTQNISEDAVCFPQVGVSISGAVV